MLIDSHVHLNMPEFKDDLDDVVARARGAGVVEMLNIGCDPDSIDGAVELTDRYEDVYAAVGIHPHSARDWNDDLEKRIKKLLLRRKVLALGEIGLDYYRDLSPRQVQKDVFRRQIGAAIYFNKPIVVHSREAHRDVVDILRQEGASEVGGIFHAFSGGADEAREALELGFLIGIGGPITYKGSRHSQLLLRLSSGAFVLETDCPYLSPVPHRGRRNEPAYVRLVAEKVAETMGISVQDVERSTGANYRRLMHGDKNFPVSIAYHLKGNIYVNVTGTCTNDCTFCARGSNSRFIYGHNLNLVTDPTVEEMVSAVREAIRVVDCGEIVFCGYGEPTTRIGEILKVARSLKDLGRTLRLNTNGQGNMINGRNIVPELESVFDRVSVSMNAPDHATYLRLCRPDSGARAFDAVLDFIRKAAASRMECVVTALDYPGVDLDACRVLVGQIPGAVFRVRRYRLNV